MTRKKKEELEDNEPLSEFQDVSKTGRTEGEEAEPVHSRRSRKKEIVEKVMDIITRPAKPIDIRSAELVDQMFCKYKYTLVVAPNTVDTISRNSELPVHHDLVGAFRKLDAHFALICEEVEADKIGDINDIDHQPTADKIEKFTVTKFSLDGDADSLSVVLIGLKELSTGEQIKMETPKKRVDGSYPFAVELSSTIDDCVTEVELYMQGVKQAETPQLAIEFEQHNSFVEEDL